MSSQTCTSFAAAKLVRSSQAGEGRRPGWTCGRTRRMLCTAHDKQGIAEAAKRTSRRKSQARHGGGAASHGSRPDRAQGNAAIRFLGSFPSGGPAGIPDLSHRTRAGEAQGANASNGARLWGRGVGPVPAGEARAVRWCGAMGVGGVQCGERPEAAGGGVSAARGGADDTGEPQCGAARWSQDWCLRIGSLSSGDALPGGRRGHHALIYWGLGPWLGVDCVMPT